MKHLTAGRRLLIIVLILALVMTAAGCGKAGGNSSGSSAGGSPSVDAEQSGVPVSIEYDYESFSEETVPEPVLSDDGSFMEVRDCIGRVVRIPSDAGRVAVLDSFSAEAAVMTGAGDRMVSCPNGVKSDSILRTMCPGLEDVEVVMSGGSFNAESLLQLSPDVIIIKAGVYASDEERIKLEKLQIPYLVTSYENMAEQIYALKLAGAACGVAARQKAAEISAYYCDVIRRSASDAAMIPEEERLVVYHSINEAVRTDGADSLGCDWITCAGGVDVSAEYTGAMQKDGVDYCAGIEQIFSWDPDIMICNEASTKDYLLTDEKWAGLRAVREKAVYNIPVGATRWGQRGSLETFFAIIWFGTEFYPEYYDDFDLREEVNSFYSNITGIEITDDLYEMMLSGTGIRERPH